MENTAKRRRRSKAERRQIVEETLQGGASVAQIARANGVNANQVFNWRKLYQAGQLEVDPPLLPVKIAEVPPVIVPPAKCSDKVASGVIDVDLGHARIRIEGSVSPACVRAVIEGLRR